MIRSIGLLLSVFLLFIATFSTKNKKISGDQEKENRITVRSDFKVEHLFSPSEAGLGSWVAMTFDTKGRIIASDQFGVLYRLTPDSKPIVEKLEIENETLAIGAAQGLLYAFDGLYVMVNNNSSKNLPRQSGLYKLEDTDGNDQFDKITLLKELHGEGEHGPHSIILSPDGHSLYVIAGNHTDAPEMDSYRLPKTWQHDNLYPFIKDPRGHATDRKEPGGWIAKVDPYSNTWEMVAAGFRNAFDIAFNEAGDLFAYDADMEWDFGLPWYRPTRICHVSSGSEFGWRTGSAKWPTTFADNLPPVINIGQGSPTNLISLKDAKFPKEYQNTLLAFDWSFGIVHAIHLEPSGSSYSAQRTEFLSGVPLPLTDGVIGPDGALYFLTGGRRLQSDLYRVSYTGKDIKTSTEPVITDLHKIRRNLETFHEKPDPKAIAEAWPYLNHEDRFIRYAARIAVEHQPLNEWSAKALNENDDASAIYALMALIRSHDQPDKNEILKALLKINYDKLTTTQKLDFLRDVELLFARTGQPEAVLKKQFLDRFLTKFPDSENEDINRQLSKLLVFLNDPDMAQKLVKTIGSPEQSAGQELATSSEDLILRNPAYGLDIAKMLEKLPPQRQTYYAVLLSELKSGWTPDLREKYFSWYEKAFQYKGGLSYVGFLNAARKTALSTVSKDKYDYYDKLSGGDGLNQSGIDLTDVTFPQGPGRNWKTDEATALFETPLKVRDFEHGRNMYLATLCSRCHTLNGEGSNVGPDLTHLGTRFTVRDILEAIIEPNKVISDQYASTQFQLKNGESLVGKIISENQDHVKISQNPFTPDVLKEIRKNDIVSRQNSPISMMLPGLINGLNEEELKDLMAYLIAGGRQDHEYFKK